MSSVAEIENAIQRLSIAEQRIIARHLGTSLRASQNSKEHALADEGIPSLENELCPTAGALAVEERSRPRAAKKRARSHVTHLM